MVPSRSNGPSVYELSPQMKSRNGANFHHHQDSNNWSRERQQKNSNHGRDRSRSSDEKESHGGDLANNGLDNQQQSHPDHAQRIDYQQRFEVILSYECAHRFSYSIVIFIKAKRSTTGPFTRKKDSNIAGDRYLIFGSISSPF